MDHEGFGYHGRPHLRVGNFREMPGSDILRQGYLKKLKTMKKKYFVLRSTSSSGPARLDYYDSEKKFKTNQPPKRSIHLHECFNINKKSDTKHKYAIVLYLSNDCFSVIAEDQEEQSRWLSLMLEYQNEYMLDGDIQKAHYEYVWQGIVKPKTPQSLPGIQGSYRVCLSEKSICLVKLFDIRPSFEFMLSSIRRCGHSDNSFFMEVGRSAVTGAGELWVQVEETFIAQAMHDKVLSEMTSRQSDFRGRSNTGGSTISRRSTIHGDEPPFIRKRATSESHHGGGSPRRMRGSTMQRPQSTVVYQRSLAPEAPLVLPSTSPHSTFDSSFLEERVRSDSMGSRSSRTSKHSDFTDSLQYQNCESVTSPEHLFLSVRSQTPETSVSITEEDPMDMENSDYLSMTPGQRSMTPSPTRCQMERSTTSSDYLPMTPTRRSGTPSPTRFLDRPGSASSEPQDVNMSDGYMDMRPSSLVSSPASNSSGYIDMLPGQRTPTDPGPGYMIMDAGWVRGTAPIPIRSTKEVGYMDMGPSSQPLPTVKEGGSGEAYLPMSPAGQSPLSSEGLKPTKVFSYLSDDSMSGEFPKRAYSVGSRPTPKPTHRQYQIESIRRQPLDSSKSSSAPHLILQKSRNVDPYNKNYMDMSSNASSLNQSEKSDDADSLMEMDFYRPRTASDSYGCRPRASSLSKQVYQGHRPRSSSYGQASKLSKLVTSARVDSFESVRRASQDFMNRKRSQESLSKYSCSSSESLKKLSEDPHKKAGSDYMDMGFEKNNKASSPTVHGIGSPKANPTGYVDMTLGSSTPKGQRGLSPSSSSHSLGSSPASRFTSHHQEKSHEPTKVVLPSGKVAQKQGFKPALPSQQTEQQLKVATSRLKQVDKKSPASSGKESEDESYVPFQPGAITDNNAGIQFTGSHDLIPRSHPGVTVQHGYSRSYDSAVKSTEFLKKSKNRQSKKEEKSKHNTPKQDKPEKESKGKKEKEKGKRDKAFQQEKGSSGGHSPKSPLQSRVESGHSPEIERKIDYIPESDLFSNAIFTKSAVNPDQAINRTATSSSSISKGDNVSKTNLPSSSLSKADDSGYMEYLPGFEGDFSSPASTRSTDGGNRSDSKSVDISRMHKRGSTGFSPSLGKSGGYVRVKESYVPNSSVGNRTTISESDYVLSDPITNLEVAADVLMLSPSSENSARPIEETFSYMDFDPSCEKSDHSSKEPMKSPVRVQSFIAPTKDSAKKETVIGQGQTKSSGVSKCLPNPAAPHGNNQECISETQKSADLSGKLRPKTLNSNKKQDIIKVKASGFSKEKEIGGNVKLKSDDKTTVIDSTSSINSTKRENARKSSKPRSITADEMKAKFFVMKYTTDQEIMDEGYIELDFTPHQTDKECKNHRRSGSSSSTTSAASDRSRKGTDSCIEESVPAPSPIVSFISVENDTLPKPKVPVSYICDTSQSDFPISSYPSKDQSSPSSPSKEGSSQNSFESGLFNYNKLRTSTSSLDSSQGWEVLTSSPVQPLNLSQVNQVFGQLSRQSSVPIVPSYSPRTCEDIQSIRSRKASGPATFSGARKSSGGSSSIGQQLETLPAGQELQKQVSMPCMNIPMSHDRIRTDKSQDMGQRHSYTDLSQYEEMSPVSNDLEKVNAGKSNSQQQLADVSQENKLNYVDLDLKGSSENVDEKLPRVNYATINFEKTESLKTASAKEEVKLSL